MPYLNCVRDTKISAKLKLSYSSSFNKSSTQEERDAFLAKVAYQSGAHLYNVRYYNIHNNLCIFALHPSILFIYLFFTVSGAYDQEESWAAFHKIMCAKEVQCAYASLHANMARMDVLSFWLSRGLSCPCRQSGLKILF